MEFSLKDTLESGQVFRWRLTREGALLAHADKLYHITRSTAEEPELKNMLRQDQPRLTHWHPHVQKAIEETRGLRILRQDPWECLVTFIISQNNNQKRIQKNCLDISKAYGKPLEQGFYTFPKPQQLGSEEELRALGMGYRAKWIARLKNIDLEWLKGLKNLDYEEAKKELCKIDGVGPKVADCTLLFSLGFDEACPEDVWIKKVFSTHNLTRKDLGTQAGLLQQHLFHHARSKQNQTS